MSEREKLPALKHGAERAECQGCGGDGLARDLKPCAECLGTGLELTREDHVRLAASEGAESPEEMQDDGTGVR